jgi:hypothetical protein
MKETTMRKTVKAAKPVITRKQRNVIKAAYGLGFNASGAFASAVAALACFTVADKEAVIQFGLGYKAGYVVRYMQANANMKRRWGNLDDAALAEAGADIYSKPYPDSTKPNRRTDLEHKACRAADVSLNAVKARAGLSNPKKRKPRPAANKNEPPRELVAATPKLATKEAVNDHFGVAAAALLATVNANAKRVSPQLSSAVAAFHASLKALGLLPRS